MQRLLNGGGITVSEIAPMDGPVDVTPETTAAFVGRTLRGPLHTPVAVRNGAEFRRRFGDDWRGSTLGPAVKQFFEHGGRSLYVVRVANNARGAMLNLPGPQGALVLRAVEPGSAENIRASVDYDAIHGNDDEHFNLTIQRIAPDTGFVTDQEIYRRLSCDDGDRHYIGTALAGSELARPQMPLPPGRPNHTTDPLNRFDPGYVGHSQPGHDGQPLSDYDLIGSAVEGTGLFALNQVERFDLLYLPPPSIHGDLGPAAVLAAELYCRKRGAMLLLDPPAVWRSTIAALDGVRSAGFASPNILTYFPRMYSRGGDGSPPLAVGGAIGGLLAKLDRVHGPWRDLDLKDLRFHRDLVPAVPIDEHEIRQLIREGVNVLAPRGPDRPAAVRGSVTLARNCPMDRRFVSLGVRRLCLAITNAVERATRWAVFEPNEKRVAEHIQSQVHACLSSLADAGAFADDNFIVQCDAGLHAQPLDPHRGVTILLGFRPAGAETTVSLTLHQTVRGCRVVTTAFAPSMAQCA